VGVLGGGRGDRGGGGGGGGVGGAWGGGAYVSLCTCSADLVFGNEIFAYVTVS